MPASTVYKFSISQEHLDIVKQTLPLVARAGPPFTKHFYKILFETHPELRNLFNQTNQAKGKQPQKLLTTVALAGQAAIETGVLPGEAIEGICQKHAALNIPPEAYDIVGQNLLQAIKDLLTDDSKVLEAWGSLYNDISTVFITREAEINQATAHQSGGWLGRRTFTLQKKEMVSSNIVRLTFAPKDNGEVPKHVPGQYTTLWVPVSPSGDKEKDHYREQPRHYTLATPETEDEQGGLTISVKKDGLVSERLHEAIIGSPWELSAPHGCFNMEGVEKLWLSEPDAPVVFISAGVGITPGTSSSENFCFV